MNWVSSLRRRPGEPRSTSGSPTVAIRVPLWSALRFWSNRHRALASAAGYLASVAGVLAVTWLISLVLPRYRIANISMIYLLLVLALAVWAGSGPAILASVGSFFALDWFFVPPVGRWTVSDPDEWLALFLFLVVAVITGQLAAGLRRRAAEARRRTRETVTLYELSMAVLGDARLERVLQVIAERMRTNLGLRAVSILLWNPAGELAVATEIGDALGEAETRDRLVNARWALEASAATDRVALGGNTHLTRPIGQTYEGRPATSERAVGSYLPIVLGSQPLGVVAVLYQPGASSLSDEQRRLLNAFVAQTALAVGRAKLSEEEEKARAAAESERMKSTFLASVSHDLRTPLTSIKAAADGLWQDAEARADPPHRELAASIGQEVGRLDRLVGNLLEISRIEAGGLPLNVALEDLSGIVGSVVSRLSLLLGHHYLAVEIPDDFPLVPVDAVEFDRVLTNLLENAVKFSPTGSQISVELRADSQKAYLRVHNSGRPLLPDERVSIFEKFVRREAGRNSSPGVGLGLAICKGIVEAHGGDIFAENEENGVTIVARLPLALASDGDERRAGSVPV